MNAALGGVSAAGIGTPESEVTQSGGGPNTFIAIQSGGSAGGVRLSKFSFLVSWCQQGIHGSGVGVGPAAAKVLTSSLSAAAGLDAVAATREAGPA
jgi:hypothetical protein